MLSTNFLSGGGSKGDGVNLLTGTKDFLVEKEWVNLDDWDTENERYNGFVVKSRSGAFEGLYQRINAKAGEKYTLSGFVKTDSESSKFALFTRSSGDDFRKIAPDSADLSEVVTTEWKRISYTVSIVKDVTLCMRFEKSDANGKFYVCGLSLQRGIVTNPIWTPAPEDIVTHTELEQAVTGENLVLDSAKKASNNSYLINAYKLSSPIELNQTYTVTIFGNIEDGREFVPFFGSDSADRAGELKKVSDGVYRLIFKKTSWSHPNDDKTLLSVFGIPDNSTNAEISRIKLEKGSNPNPIYTPAPRDQLFAALDPLPEAHRNNWRGRNLGESTQMSEAHKAAIADGSFRDLWVGDYWTHNGINYRIWDLNYFYNVGNQGSQFVKNHLVIGTDTGLYGASMNDSNLTDTGYANSDMRTKNLDNAKDMFNEAFPDMVLTHRELLTDKATDGVPSNADWYDCTVEIPNEIMMYGCYVMAVASTGTTLARRDTVGCTQFAAFRLNPNKMLKIKQNYWLRDVASRTEFSTAVDLGMAFYRTAVSKHLVRPYACIGVQTAADEPDSDLEVTSLSKGGEAV